MKSILYLLSIIPLTLGCFSQHYYYECALYNYKLNNGYNEIWYELDFWFEAYINSMSTILNDLNLFSKYAYYYPEVYLDSAIINVYLIFFITFTFMLSFLIQLEQEKIIIIEDHLLIKE